MSAHPFDIIAQKLFLNPDLIAGLTCSVGLIQHFPKDPAGTLFIAIDADLSNRESVAWRLYRLLSGKEVDRDHRNS